MEIEFTQAEKNCLIPLLKNRFEEEKKLDTDFKESPFYKKLNKSLENLIDKMLLNEPVKLTKNYCLNIRSCINPELDILLENQFIKKSSKEAIEWINIQKTNLVILEKIDILESIFLKADKKYKPRQYFEIFELINSLKCCKNIILSKCNNSYFYKIRFVKKNYDIFQIELSNILNLEYKRFSKSTKIENSKDLMNKNVNLYTKEEALSEILKSDFVLKAQNKNTFDFIIKILSEE